MHVVDPDYRTCAKDAITALQRWYHPMKGQWQGAGWWNAANALTTIIGYTKLTGDSSYENVIETTYTAAARQNPDFINDYYDDNGWWALAWVAAYDLTQQSRYLSAARTIFDHNTTAWTDTCGGGLIWHKTSTYKNAITTELFLTLAALLHQRTPGDQMYQTWALRAWDWFSASGLIGANGLINDGLNPQCQNNGETTWTYNQGVILGGLGALFQITGDQAYLAKGESIANAALSLLTTPASAAWPGILVEPCESATPGCDGDQTQFKGIFVRYLYGFWQLTHQAAYKTFILGNAHCLWQHNKNAANQFGLCWTGPFDHADVSRQSSALDILVAASALTP